jgi:hypothetical protein
MNPFTPAFGDLPPILVGRSQIIKDIKSALETRSLSDPYRAVLFKGARGTGKTALLGEISDIALKLGYVVVNVTAGSNLAVDIINFTHERAAHLLKPQGRKLSSVSIGKFGFTFEEEPRQEVGFRLALERLVREINEQGAGVLITVDEVYKTANGIEELSTSFQHFKQEGRDVSIMLAGLPKNISDILVEDDNIKNLTFLRRAERVELGNVSIDDIEKSYKDVLGGKYRVSKTLLRRMAEATDGYPFMIQLVGYYTVKSAKGNRITEADVRDGISEAKRRMGNLVLSASLLDLSEKDKEILNVIAGFDDDIVEVSSIAGVTGESSQYVQLYKSRLTEAGMIEPAGYGKVSIAIPYLKEYLRKSGDS